jgi:hypothetical protein
LLTVLGQETMNFSLLFLDPFSVVKTQKMKKPVDGQVL